MTSTEGEDGDKNYGWKSAFFLRYPSMFGKVQWRFRDAMTGSRMLIDLSVKGGKSMLIIFQRNCCFCISSGQQNLQCLDAEPSHTWVKVCRAAEAVAPPRTVNGRNTHSRRWREVGQMSCLRIRRQVDCGALASGRALLPLPGKQVATGTTYADLPLDLYRIAAHSG